MTTPWIKKEDRFPTESEGSHFLCNVYDITKGARMRPSITMKVCKRSWMRQRQHDKFFTFTHWCFLPAKPEKYEDC